VTEDQQKSVEKQKARVFSFTTVKQALAKPPGEGSEQVGKSITLYDIMNHRTDREKMVFRQKLTPRDQSYIKGRKWDIHRRNLPTLTASLRGGGRRTQKMI